MLSIVGNKSVQEDQSKLAVAIAPPLNLRRIRNRFFKYYIRGIGKIEAQDLSALLLYFALSFIENKRSLAELFKTAPKNKELIDLADNELLILGNEVLGLLDEFLPKDLIDVMVVPNKVSWQRAAQFFKEENGDVLFADIANLGFAYQIFSSSDRKEKTLPALQKANKKISKEELIAFTQLYTPGWVADFLVSNTILSGYKSDKISNRYSRWLIAKKDDIVEKTENCLEDFSLIDPACGAGQFIFSAFDLLSELYELKGHSKQSAAKLILNNNIFAADIDEKALWVTGLGLLSKYLVVCDSVMPMPGRLSSLVLVKNIDAQASETDFLGSIDNRLPNNHLLKKQYSVVVTNPPYIGRRCLSREIKKTLKEQYPNSCTDLAAAFFERCLTMLKDNGKFGVITQSSLMSIPSYKVLRNYLLENFHMQAAIQCGPGVFPLATGEKIDSILLLARRTENESEEKDLLKSYFVDLNNEKDKATALRVILNSNSSFFVSQFDFAEGIPNNLLGQLSANFFKKISKLPKLADIAEIKQGLATTDNNRFVRYHFDIDEKLIGKIWVPYIKGAGAERYASDNPFVVKWENDGSEIKEAVTKAYPYLKGKTAWVVKNEKFYFRSGLCFSFINKSGLAVRRLPAGAIFDVASSAIFASPEEEDFLLAYLNSKVVGLLTKCINQTINIQVGDLKKLPIIPVNKDLKIEISRLGNLAFKTKKALLNCLLTLPQVKSEKLSANELAMILEKYISRQAELQIVLKQTQKDIDNKVMNALVDSDLISAKERKVLDMNLDLMAKQIDREKSACTERQYAYKVLNAVVSNLVSREKGDVVVLIPLVSGENLAKLFNLTSDGMDWFEDKLENSLEKIFMQPKIVDISKLAQGASRYFSFYLSDLNSCMLFSSAAVRYLKNNMSTTSIFIAGENDAALLKKVDLLWQTIYSKLDAITDWTSRDLLTTFKSIVL